MRRATIAKAGRTAGAPRFTGMAWRRVRWRNVGRAACLLGAGVLIATHGAGEAPAPLAPARPLPTPPEVQRLPRLRDIPRLVLPGPRQRRALKEGDSGGRGGPPGVMRRRDVKVTKPPGTARSTPPSPQSGAVGQVGPWERSAGPPERSAGPPERSAPTSGEFTPDPG